MKINAPIFFFSILLSGVMPALHAGAEELFHDFEEGMPGWEASANGEIAISSRHAKSGSRSLEWKWTKGDSRLSVEFPPQRVEKRRTHFTHFGFWLYNEKPSGILLRVHAYSGGKEVCSFWFNLGYRGWRALGANYLSLHVPEGVMIDKLVFRAPSAAGTLWLDAVKPAFMSTPIQSDDCQPWANNPEMLKEHPSKTYYSSRDISLNRPHLPRLIPIERIDRKLRKIMDREGKERLEKAEDKRRVNYSPFPELCDEFEKLGIIDQGKSVKGPPLEFTGGGMFLPLPNALPFNEKFLPVLEKISEAIQREKGEDKLKAEKMYLAMCRYFLDQGMQEGNNNYGWIGNGYDFRHFPSRVFIHSDLLAREGLLDSMLKSVAHLCMGKEMLSETPYSSCDQFYNFSPHLPTAILLLPDEAERDQRMRAFKQYMDKVILNDLPIGKDGSIHHHQGHHLSYGAYSPPKMLRTQILPFKGTDFFISPEAHEKIKTLVRATAFQSMHGRLAPNLYLRSGVPIGLDASALALQAAFLGSPRCAWLDKEMASLYLDALNGRDTAEARRFREEGISPTRPCGHLTLNLATIAVHRRDDWQASAAGMIRQFRGLEIYGWMENNNYGKQSRNGSLFLTIGDKTGWKREGWNWNFWPGATTSVLESHDLLEGYAMYSNTNNMGGGVSQNGNGIWGNDFSAHGVSFKKSMFFFENRITVITTDISSSPDKEVVTTLFQQSADEAITPSPSIQNMGDGKEEPAFLNDSLGNYYYIQQGSPRPLLQTREQEWTYFFQSDLVDAKDNPCIDMRKKRFRETPLSANAKYYKPTKGKFHLAYLPHGTNPKEAACAYTILIQPSVKDAEQFSRAMASSSPPVRILARNTDVHAVYDPATRTTGYVVFNPSAELPPPLKRVSRPGFVMVRDNGNEYQISLATGDPEQNKEFSIELKDGQTALIHPDYPLSGSVVIKKNLHEK